MQKTTSASPAKTIKPNLNYTILNRDDLPRDGNTFEFEGFRFDNTAVSFIWVDMPSGGGVKLHKHPYKEIFIIQDGIATFTVGASEIEAHAGQIIIIPSDTPHKFTNTGNQQLRQVDIHASRQFITYWLED